MKGVSFVNAVALIVYTLNFRKFGHDTRRIATYRGVAPFGRDSGTTLHTTPRVSHYADKYLKPLLFEAALCAMRFCAPIRRYADRLLARGQAPEHRPEQCQEQNAAYSGCYGEGRRVLPRSGMRKMKFYLQVNIDCCGQ